MFGNTRPARRLITTGGALALAVAGLQHEFSPGTVSASPLRPVTVRVTLREFSVTVSRRRLPANTPIRFIISNRGKAVHEAVLERSGADDDALKVRGREYEVDDIEPGTTRTATWSIPHAGTYQLACHMPGHFQMGMKTFFTVTPAR